MRHLFQGRDFCSSLEGYCMNQAVAGSEIPAGGPLCSLSAVNKALSASPNTKYNPSQQK